MYIRAEWVTPYSLQCPQSYSSASAISSFHGCQILNGRKVIREGQSDVLQWNQFTSRLHNRGSKYELEGCFRHQNLGWVALRWEPNEIGIIFCLFDQSTGEIANSFLNSNWKPIHAIMKPVIAEKIREVLKERLLIILELIPADYLVSNLPSETSKGEWNICFKKFFLYCCHSLNFCLINYF